MSKLKGANLSDVVRVLESFAPLILAEKWDNVGLLVQPSAPLVVKKLMLTNDLTTPVMAEAVKAGCSMIFSYHPPIFRAFKRLTQTDVKQQIIVQSLENRVAIFSPHTSHDVVNDGVNDWLLAAFGVIHEKSPVTTSGDVVQVDKRLISEEESLRLKEKYGCDLESSYGNFCYISRSSSAGFKSEAVSDVGSGRRGLLESAVTLTEAVGLVKDHLGLSHLRVAVGEGRSLDDKIKTVACCAGSGSSVLNDCDVDLYLTGEMSHHDVLHATSYGRSVILCEHSNTERGYLTRLQAKLSDLLPSVECLVSQTDADPLVIM